jgi:hypothetical protein
MDSFWLAGKVIPFLNYTARPANLPTVDRAPSIHRSSNFSQDFHLAPERVSFRLGL